SRAEAPDASPALRRQRRRSVARRVSGGELGDHLLQIALVAGLVGRDERLHALVKRAGSGPLCPLFELGGFGADRRDLLCLLPSGAFLVAPHLPPPPFSLPHP